MREEGVLGLIISVLLAYVVRKLLIKLLKGRSGNEVRSPPGPPAWPLLGHLHLFLNTLPHQALATISKNYGPVLGLRFGQLRAVAVCSPEAARDVLLTHDKVFAQRPQLLFNSFLLFGAHTGVAFNCGSLWQRHRKLCMLKLFSAHRLQELEYIRQQEVHALLLSIHQHHLACCASLAPKAAIDIGEYASQMSCRLMMRLLHSKPTLHMGDENLQQLVRDLEHGVAPTIGDLFPFLSMFDFFWKPRMRRIHACIDKVLTQMLMERRKESASLHDDLLDALLTQEAALTEIEIKALLLDLLAAGVHTTALTLEWAMAELLKHPHCLHRLQREIDAHVGEKRAVSEADVQGLNYLKCVVKEVFRLHPLGPLLIPRISSEECKLQGYVIPAETLMLVNVWAIGRDERVWPHANEFMPERFEEKEVDVRGQHFELLPFGSGRRTCLGLPLALPIVEVALANLVTFFDWELPDGETHTSVNMDESPGLTANRAAPVMAIPKPRVSIHSKFETLQAASRF